MSPNGRSRPPDQAAQTLDTTPRSPADGGAGLISIGELARRSGAGMATIRSWEARHGFPQPVRLAGGHRRYHELDVASVAEVLRLRRAGLSVRAAIATAVHTVTSPAPSFFATVRAAHPDLRPQVLTKRVLSALTSAMEDEYCARASRPVLYAAFQRAVFYRQSEPRWRELARTAAVAVVFADFDRSSARPGQAVEVALAADAPVRREWALVCDAPGYTAFVAGWELPVRARTADGDRRFETVWSLDPRLVRDAARVGAALTGDVAPADNDVAITFSEVPPPASADLHQATALFARVLAYAQENISHRTP